MTTAERSTLRVGVVTGGGTPSDGGAWTYKSALLKAIKTSSLRHTFVIIDDQETERSSPKERHGAVSTLKTMLKPARRVLKARRRPSEMSDPEASLQRYARKRHRLDTALAEAKVDIAWFLTPSTVPPSIPFIATVWDLEHRKNPFFPEVSVDGWTWEQREQNYAALLPRAFKVVTGTQVGKDEIQRYYHVGADRVSVIPFPAPEVRSTNPIENIADTSISHRFLLYPAQFWPHKNHANLLVALKLLRDSGFQIDLVLTGGDKGNLGFVEGLVQQFELEQQVRNMGFVDEETLHRLYRSASALVYPSFFGPDNLPPLEAYAVGCPVLAADIPGAQEYLGGGALLFAPTDPDDICDKVRSLCSDDALRTRLISAGKSIAYGRTAKGYLQEIGAIVDEFTAYRRCWALDS